jgi:hypothetical protein
MEDILASILKKSSDLSDRYTALKVELEDTQDERHLLSIELENQVKLNQVLHNQIKILKLAENFKNEASGDESSTELKNKIQDFIKEIDKCISLLNS